MSLLQRIDDLRLKSKVSLIAFAGLFPVLLLIFIYILPNIRDFAFGLKEETVRHPVELAYSLIDSYNAKVEKGELSEEDAKRTVLDIIKTMRFEETNYLWIHSDNNIMVMHPIKKELNGKDVTSMKDSDGKPMFIDMTKIATEKGEGTYAYMWSKPGSEIPVEKISSLKYFKKWGWIVGAGTYVEDIHEAFDEIRIPIIIYLIIIVIISLFISYIIAKRITDSMHTLSEDANRLAVGDTYLNTYAFRKDEIGDLQSAFAKMAQSVHEQSEATEAISLGNVKVNLAKRSEKDTFTESLIKMVHTLDGLVAETNGLTSSAVKGELHKRGNSTKFAGAFKEIVTGFNETLDAMINPVQVGTKALSKIAQGDFSVRISEEFQGDHKLIKESINTVAESLSQTIKEVQHAVHATASASSEISSSAEQMAAGTQEQSSQTSDVASAVEEMSKTIYENSQNATKALSTARLAKERASHGEAVVKQTISGMNQIAEVVTKSAEQVFRLGQNSTKIGEIVQVIDDIADQTNLLALNAAIEAARAGEQGRGFAVVADEVRKLAERTTKATKEIASMINQINRDTLEAVESMKVGTKEVESGKLLSSQAGTSLHEILEATDHVMAIVEQVAAASEEQSAATEEISKNIEGINSVTSETSKGVQQIAEAAEDLNRLTTNLQGLINQFKVTQTGIDRY